MGKLNLKNIAYVIRTLNDYLTFEELQKGLKTTNRNLRKHYKLVDTTPKFYSKKLNLKFVAAEHTDIADFNLGWCIGLFATDGHLVRYTDPCKMNMVQLQLSVRDEKTVIDFFGTLISNLQNDLIKHVFHKLNGKFFEQVRTCIRLPVFVSILRKFLIFDRKTYDIALNRDMFDTASDDFKIGFIRGCIDGDGWIHKECFQMGLVSASPQFIKDIQYYYGGKIYQRKKHKAQNLTFNKEEMYKLLSRGMNRNSNITMNRKSQRLKSLVDNDTPELIKRRKSEAMKRAWKNHSFDKIESIKRNLKSGRKKYTESIEGGYVSARAKAVEVFGEHFKSISSACRKFNTHEYKIKKEPSFRYI